MHALLTLLLFAAAPAPGEAPACFAERTVLWSAEFVDERGRIFGGVRAGQVVRLVRDRVGDNGALAEIETAEPTKLKARVRREQLQVFARRDMEVEAGWTWLLRNAPLQVTTSGADKAEVSPAQYCPSTAEPRMRVVVSCTDLVGVPPEPVTREACRGASVDLPQAGDPKAWWEINQAIVSADARRSLQLEARRTVRVVRREKTRVLVDLVEGGIRHQGWGPIAGMRTDDPGGVVNGCCEGWLNPTKFKRGDTPLVVDRDAVLAPFLGESRQVPVPKGTRLWSLGKKDDLTEVLWLWPSDSHKTFTFELAGWISTASLKPDSGPMPENDWPKVIRLDTVKIDE